MEASLRHHVEHRVQNGFPLIGLWFSYHVLHSSTPERMTSGTERIYNSFRERHEKLLSQHVENTPRAPILRPRQDSIRVAGIRVQQTVEEDGLDIGARDHAGNECHPVINVRGEEDDGSELIKNRPSWETSYWKPTNELPMMHVSKRGWGAPARPLDESNEAVAILRSDVTKKSCFPSALHRGWAAATLEI